MTQIKPSKKKSKSKSKQKNKSSKTSIRKQKIDPKRKYYFQFEICLENVRKKVQIFEGRLID